MMRPCVLFTSLAVVSPTGCHCPNADIVELDSDSASGTFGETSRETSTGSATSSEGSTGEPFDASRWIGRYHFENFFLPFGERGDPHGDHALINFEILPDARAVIFYDDCTFGEAVTRTYEWLPDEEGWLELAPGSGEPYLRFLGNDAVESIRIQLTEPCRELRFEIDGHVSSWLPFFPGASCWVDKCTTGSVMHVDYCEGEEPEEACP